MRTAINKTAIFHYEYMNIMNILKGYTIQF